MHGFGSGKSRSSVGFRAGSDDGETGTVRSFSDCHFEEGGIGGGFAFPQGEEEILDVLVSARFGFKVHRENIDGPLDGEGLESGDFADPGFATPVGERQGLGECNVNVDGPELERQEKTGAGEIGGSGIGGPGIQFAEREPGLREKTLVETFGDTGEVFLTGGEDLRHFRSGEFGHPDGSRGDIVSWGDW